LCVATTGAGGGGEAAGFDLTTAGTLSLAGFDTALVLSVFEAGLLDSGEEGGVCFRVLIVGGMGYP